MKNLDFGELLGLICIATISIIAICILKEGGTEIASAGLGGITGYLVKTNNTGGIDEVR